MAEPLLTHVGDQQEVAQKLLRLQVGHVQVRHLSRGRNKGTRHPNRSTPAAVVTPPPPHPSPQHTPAACTGGPWEAPGCRRRTRPCAPISAIARHTRGVSSRTSAVGDANPQRVGAAAARHALPRHSHAVAGHLHVHLVAGAWDDLGVQHVLVAVVRQALVESKQRTTSSQGSKQQQALVARLPSPVHEAPPPSLITCCGCPSGVQSMASLPLSQVKSSGVPAGTPCQLSGTRARTRNLSAGARGQQQVQGWRAGARQRAVIPPHRRSPSCPPAAHQCVLHEGPNSWPTCTGRAGARCARCVGMPAPASRLARRVGAAAAALTCAGWNCCATTMSNLGRSMPAHGRCVALACVVPARPSSVLARGAALPAPHLPGALQTSRLTSAPPLWWCSEPWMLPDVSLHHLSLDTNASAQRAHAQATHQQAKQHGDAAERSARSWITAAAGA